MSNNSVELKRLNAKLRILRGIIRRNNLSVMEFVYHNYVLRVNEEAVKNNEYLICMVCGSHLNITREHIIPRWCFRKDTKKYFDITVNGHTVTYNKATIPTCSTCNAELLNSLERYIQKLFHEGFEKDFAFNIFELQHIIRWLETIDYKFQIMNISKKFLSPKNGKHIPYLSDFPLYLLLPNKGYSPAKILSTIRYAHKRLAVKDKANHVNSLLIFKTSNQHFHFFHTIDDFIFLEIPQYKIALFYFFKEQFKETTIAYKKAMEVINKVY
ncbi:hypothetical protein QT327_18985 [Olivibacter sp. 47]|uniref:hypothetical protein n=1 Tax=Olivibacter sp. 47 TaxID=3056486 RepID=UPI0025A3F65B|nr:hypothetical protein [Olivibacter sp. 47]MDM8176401.1 hypothetical protein [Olivibacter sp. 47]